MPKKKLPFDAFDFYFSLGPNRSYRAVADKYEVSKTAVANAAEKENWQKRITDCEQKARENVDKKAVETLEQMSDRHLKYCKIIQRKALETLKTLPLSTAMDAVKALNLSIKQERLARGEPTERHASVEEIIKREYERWMTGPDETTEEATDDRDTVEAAE